jgi:glycogen debranching enzyme
VSRASVPSPWNPAAEPAALGSPGSYVMIVEGQSFCLADGVGDIHRDTPHGLFIGDVRVLSRFVLLLDDVPLDALEHHLVDASSVEYVGRSRAQHATVPPLVVVRRRSVLAGLREEIELRNYASSAASVMVRLVFDADFAELFAVKEHRAERRGEHELRVLDNAVAYDWRHRGAERRVVVEARGHDAVARPGSMQWAVRIPPRGSWAVSVDVGLQMGALHEPMTDGRAPATRRPPEPWSGRDFRCAGGYGPLDRAVRRSLVDLDALRLHDPAGEARPVIAAGAPWFMTLFGRDALIAAWMALPVDPSLALGVLEAIARHQGTENDPETEEQPGRVLHEMRWGSASSLSLGGGLVYYGTADATPLFVMLLGELVRWGGIDEASLRALVPHADAALAWIEGPGDLDGDGYVEYHCPTSHGLRNQGWKDSWDGVRFADGRVAEPPIALCEVQAYAIAALRARAVVARRLGDEATASRCDRAARERMRRFTRDFVLDDGRLAFGLDRDKRHIDATVSNAGHALWCGALEEHAVAGVAAALLSPAMWSGWGVRTMASDAGGYDPMSYHCGSVWPHDNAIVAAGLARSGFATAAGRIIDAQLDVADRDEGRLPELLSGLSRDDIAVPVRFPTSCAPQAWAAASPLLHLRTMLGFEPDLTEGVVHVRPNLPEHYGEVVISGWRIGEWSVTLRADGHRCRIEGLPPEVRVVHGRHDASRHDDERFDPFSGAGR